MGGLYLIGLGHRPGGQVTVEVRACVQGAGALFHLLTDPLSRRWVERENVTAQSLLDCFVVGRSGYEASAAMAQRVLASLRKVETVCVAFPGHPRIAVVPAAEMLQSAREAGFEAVVLPGVSALDCLFADLEFDPAALGWQVFDATDFLLQGRRFDPTSALVLLQAGAIGVRHYVRELAPSPSSLRLLEEALRENYPSAHEIVLYETASTPVHPARIERVSLARLPHSRVTLETTLYVPPLGPRPLDQRMLARMKAAWKRPTPS